MRVQLLKDGQEMVATDGRMWIDGRLSLSNAIIAVRRRNKNFEKNLPHKICDGFIWKGKSYTLKISLYKYKHK